MKRIIRSLWVLTLSICFIGQSFAQNCKTVDGQVRYGFELKKLTAAQAQQAVQNQYIDLWTYMCFDEAFVNENLIILNSDKTAISQLRIAVGEATHSYKMVDKYGNDDRTGSVAMFARPMDNTCSGGGRLNVYQDDIENDLDIPVNSSLAHTPIQKVCPTWAYSSSSSRTTGFITGNNALDLCTIIQDENGKTWYCLKMYLMRFEYKQPQSFYVTFYRGDAVDGVTSNGASNFNVFSNSTFTQQLIWPGQTCGSAQDWSGSSYFGFIQGGVEIESDPEMQLVADKTCGGEDLSGKLDVKSWNQKTWADY
ncbi:MAG: hypothetical protein NC396_05985, partial [Bacteroides sp.]|nr:hypothetical protein [Bacteroides sp.]